MLFTYKDEVQPRKQNIMIQGSRGHTLKTALIYLLREILDIEPHVAEVLSLVAQNDKY